MKATAACSPQLPQPYCSALNARCGIQSGALTWCSRIQSTHAVASDEPSGLLGAPRGSLRLTYAHVFCAHCKFDERPPMAALLLAQSTRPCLAVLRGAPQPLG